MAVKAYPHQKFALSAKNHRNLSPGGVGIVDPGDLAASAGSGYASNITAGRCRMRSNVGGIYTGGIYEVLNDATLALTHSNPGGSARIDQIVARISDIADLGSGSDLAELAIVTGTASGGTLDNRTGATALAANEILLWDVLVPNGAGSAASFTYRDRRPYAIPGVVPKALSGGTFDAVCFDPVGKGIESDASIAVAAVNYQAAHLMFLPAAITATKIRFAYKQGSTAATGNYIVSIYDASGRLIVSSSSTAFTGAGGSFQAVSLTISSTRFEAGLYYVHIGTTIATASSAVYFSGVAVGSAASAFGPVALGIAKHVSSGGVTPPTTLLSMTDSSTAQPPAIAVPIVELATA